MFKNNIPLIIATDNNIKLVKDFLYNKWIERAVELAKPVPNDLSKSSKFSSLLCNKLFGGDIQGNNNYQYNVLPSGKILDLNSNAADVLSIETPYYNDIKLFENDNYINSFKSCLPRVNKWINEFMQSHKDRLDEVYDIGSVEVMAEETPSGDWSMKIVSKKTLSSPYWPSSKIIGLGSTKEKALKNLIEQLKQNSFTGKIKIVDKPSRMNKSPLDPNRKSKKKDWFYTGR